MNTLNALVSSAAQLGAISVLEELGLTAGEISGRKARDTYHKWFTDAVANKRIRPSRTDGKTNWYSVKQILSLRTEDLAKPYANLNTL